MYNQQPYQPSFGQQQQQQQQQQQFVQSQYRGFQRPFQPTGNVQSFYQQPQQLQQQQQPAGFASQAPTSYHLPNYAGNQPGHDVSWREDSLAPSTFAAPRPQGIGAPAPQPVYGTAVQPFQQQGQPMNVQPQQYHLPNYVGSQPGHDASWREDSLRPSTFATGRPQTFGAQPQGTYTAGAPANALAQGPNQFRSF